MASLDSDIQKFKEQVYNAITEEEAEKAFHEMGSIFADSCEKAQNYIREVIKRGRISNETSYGK